MNQGKSRTLAAALLSATSLCLALAAPALAAAAKSDAGAWTGRNYDLRTTIPAPQSLAGDPAREAAIAELKASMPDLYVSRDERSGATRSLQNLTGYLSGPRGGGGAELLATDFVRERLALFGLTEDDLAGHEVTNVVPSRSTGLSHVYLRQRYEGIPVYNGQLQVNLRADGRVLSVHNHFVPRLAAAVNRTEPAIAATAAVESVAALLGDRAAGMSDGAASARLMILPIRAGEARLVWNFQVETADRKSWYNATVDAVDGRVWTLADWVDPDTYKVYELPVESPNHTVPVPPADGRTSQVDPADTNAAPFAWHDTNGAAGAEFTTTQGNNVHAYTDLDDNDLPDAGSSPDGGAPLLFDFPLDLTLAPSGYRPAAVTNLFYWNNIQHDVLYQYGFDEVGGNFQENNYGNGALGSDYVNAEAQDGGGTNNANFATPPDGQNPRMQMYVWTAPNPDRDGDFDNGIILHEYGHGVSNRLTGGPANVDCLDNSEQMGEGWSDWMSVWFTALPAHTATTNRGVGTYALNQPVNGTGIRPAPYNTDMAVNNYTYSNLPAMAIPHGVGFVWNTMLWEMYWELVTEHGFNTDLYDPAASGGNNLAMQLVIDGMKLQPCSPGFVDGRNAILAADLALTGGDNACLIWEAFAKRGLGATASQGSSASAADGTAAFDMPNSCLFLGTPDDSQQICAGDPAVYTVAVGSSFTPPVTLTATGNPAPSTPSFSPNPVVSLPGNSTLTIGNTAAVAPGGYVINVRGNGDAVNDLDLGLDVVVGVPGVAALTSPLDSTTVGTVRPTFQWGAVAGASGYVLEIDDDPAFGSLDYTSPVAGTSHLITSDLTTDEVYYWRVIASNACGDGAFSAVRHFAVAGPVQVCKNPNLPVPDNAPAGVNDVFNVTATGILADLDVKLVITHTWPGDLKVTLAKGGPPTTLFDRPGVPASTFGCSTDNVDVVVNDEGTGTIEAMCNPAPPGIGGNAVGTSPLSAFDGQNINGAWTLNVSDLAAADLGTLVSWCLIGPDSMPFIDGFESSNTSAWSSTQALQP
jgi:extracellular elastinolytic metalloproteinase